jgi:hypothetical protein
MPICKNCGDKFPYLIIEENGKRIDMRKRSYCLKCNPHKCRNFWGSKATRKTTGEKRKYIMVEKKCSECGKKHMSASNLKCSTCINRKTRQKRRDKAYAILGGKCKICGYKESQDAFDIHHIKGDDKIFTLSCSWGLKWSKIQEELKKCILLCCRCHREVHAGNKKII